MRTNIDFSPFRRSSIGFDRLIDLLETTTERNDATDGYPPFDLRRDGEDRDQIRLAVASFRRGDIEFVAQQNQLVVGANKAEPDDDKDFLHRGSQFGSSGGSSSSPTSSR